MTPKQIIFANTRSLHKNVQLNKANFSVLWPLYLVMKTIVEQKIAQNNSTQKRHLDVLN